MTIGTLTQVPSTLGSLVYTPYRQYQALGDATGSCPCVAWDANEVCTSFSCAPPGGSPASPPAGGTVTGCIDSITGLPLSSVLGGLTDGMLAWPLWIGQSGASPLTDLFALQTWMCDPSWAIGVILPPLAVAV